MLVALLGKESKGVDNFGSLLPIGESCVTNFYKISTNPFEQQLKLLVVLHFNLLMYLLKWIMYVTQFPGVLNS